MDQTNKVILMLWVNAMDGHKLAFSCDQDSLVPRLLSVGREKELGTQYFHMLSCPGFLGIQKICFVTLTSAMHANFSRERCLPLTTLSADDDKE